MTTEAPERDPFDAEVIFSNGFKAGLERAAQIAGEAAIGWDGVPSVAAGEIAKAISAEKDKP